MKRILLTTFLAACSTAPAPDPVDQLSESRLELARALMDARAADHACTVDAHREEVLLAIASALRTDPALAPIVAADPAFAALQDDLDFRLMVDGVPASPAALKSQLTGVTVYSGLETVEFESGGVARITWADSGREYAGDWWLDGMSVVVDLPAERLSLTLAPDGTLWNDGDARWFSGLFECA